MLQQLRQSRLLYWTVELLAAALLILVVTQLSFILEPIGKFIGAVFVPLIVSGFFYYLLNPIVGLLQKIHVGKFRLNRVASIAIVMVLLIALIVAAFMALVPALATQLGMLVDNAPGLIKTSQSWIAQLSETDWVKDIGVNANLQDLQAQVQKYGETLISGTASSLSTLIGTITSVTITAVTVPVMTIYMLNDGQKLVPFLQKIFPGRNEGRVAEILGRLNKTIAQYISGQAIEMIFVGVATTIGYFIIGQNYALLLGIFAGLTNLIPYVGPYIGLVPAIFVAFTQDVWQVVWVVVVVLIVQQIDSNLIYPRIMGASLNIHPLTIIILLLAAGNIAGIAGMILAVPFYAVVRTVIVYAWQLWQIEKQQRTES
ncbi:AI-2E family transporter [Weissella confusa]